MREEFTFNWQWDIKSKPEAIWPLPSDTNRFSRETGQPRFREHRVPAKVQKLQEWCLRGV